MDKCVKDEMKVWLNNHLEEKKSEKIEPSLYAFVVNFLWVVIRRI